ncbi:MAG TPA: redoxin domain-containing protein [Candidatus Thermoplasmatota archaeon]|nr:redoxin domain-containing protein [Candidatus Thermoplasmatota archaeon]
MALPRLPLLVVATLAAVALSGCLSGPSTGDRAPDFEVRALSGETLNLTTYEGKVLLLDFMASWCGPCQEEAPAFRAVQEKYGAQGLEVVMVSVDLRKEEPAALRAFADRFGLNVTFAQDHTSEAKVRYGVTRLPTLAIIDRDGRLVETYSGEVVTAEFMEERITPLLARAPGEAPPASTESVTSWLFLVFAFNAGVLTFFSPCGFPMLPAYIAYYLNLRDGEGGFTARSLGRGLLGGAAAGLGALSVIAAVAALAVAAGNLVTDHVLLLELLGGLFLVGMGAAYLLDKGPSFTVPAKPSARRGYLSLVGFGALYAAVAAGCVAPLLVGILVPALASTTAAGALGVFAAYAAGMVGLLVGLTVVLATTRGLLVNRLKRVLPYVKRAGGAIMIAVGAYLVGYWWSLQPYWPFA